MSDYEVTVETVPQMSELLGRQMVHDERSRAFPMRTGTIDRSAWRDRVIRVYDPLPNPNQEVGCCTGVSKCSQLNAAGNRVKGRVLGMADAIRIYSRNTQVDPWDGEFPPTDTGSSGLASAKTAQEFGLGGEYRWLFGGADEVVQNVMEGRVISVGTWWYSTMFDMNEEGVLSPENGMRVGGHQYVIRGYDVDNDRVMGRCWWGGFRDFWMKRDDLNELLLDGGDAHWQATA